LLRPAVQDDIETLWVFLAIAAYKPDAAAAKTVPIVAAHLAGWQRPTDFGIIAEQGGVVVGAAWARQFSCDEQPIFYVDEQTPEVSIGVKENLRGQGVGDLLLRGLRSEAEQRGVGLCLNVHDTNPAVRLYEKIGFRRLHGTEVRNRSAAFRLAWFWSIDGQHTKYGCVGIKLLATSGFFFADRSIRTAVYRMRFFLGYR
jgi:GNAT superfamily N-acetyltransferase